MNYISLRHKKVYNEIAQPVLKTGHLSGVNQLIQFVLIIISERTRQIIRYRATATLRRPQIKQNTA